MRQMLGAIFALLWWEPLRERAPVAESKAADGGTRRPGHPQPHLGRNVDILV